MSLFWHIVHNCYYCIISRRLRKFHHKINTQGILLEVWNWQQIKLTNWEISHRLGLKTKIISANILANIPWHLRPPIIPWNKLQYLPLSSMLWYRETIWYLRLKIYKIYILLQKRSRLFTSDHSDKCWDFTDEC